jgi:hypothetical protein
MSNSSVPLRCFAPSWEPEPSEHSCGNYGPIQCLSLNLKITKGKKEDRQERQIGLYRRKCKKGIQIKRKNKARKEERKEDGKKENRNMITCSSSYVQEADLVLCWIQSNNRKLTSQSNV